MKNIRTIMAYALPVVILMLFVFIMLSPIFLKGEKVSAQIQLLSADINNENWHAAEKNYAILEQEWHNAIQRIQFGENRDDINELSRNIVRLKGLIMAKDKPNALSELIEANFRWHTLGV